MYEVKLYVDKDVHYLKVNAEGLDEIRLGLDDDVSPKFIEVYCHDEDGVFGINRRKVSAYTYKEASE